MSTYTDEFLRFYSKINKCTVVRFVLWAKGGNVWAACPSTRCPLVGVADVHGC